MALEVWTQPSGYSLGTFPELVHLDFQLPVSNDTGVNYTVISGSLPSGIFIEGDRLIGSPYVKNNVLEYTFCIRASNGSLFADRTFSITVNNVAQPEFITPSGTLDAGLHHQFYVLDGSYVSYQIQAVDLNPEPGQTLTYYMGDKITVNNVEQYNVLPPGLTMSPTGLISGFVGPALVSPSGQPHTFTQTYSFAVTVTDGINYSTRTFDIFVADPNAFRADSLMTDSFASKFTADSTYLQQPIWMTDSDLGLHRANNYLTIPVGLYDNGNTAFRLEPTNIEVYATTYQYDNDSNRTGSYYLTISNTSVAPTYGQYFSFQYYVDGADNTLYQILSVQNLGDGMYKLHLTSPLTLTLDNGIPFYIGSKSTLPPGMSFDAVTSELYGRIPYQPAITTSYTFTLTAVRSYIASNEKVYSSRTFNISLLGDITSEISWTTPADLGTIDANYASLLYISASSNLNNAILNYEQISGSLPPGLNLTIDGEIVGSVNQYYNPETGDPGLITIDNSTTTFDGRSTTFDRSYSFTVKVNDQYLYSSSSRTFTVAVNTPNTIEYSNIIARPFLPSNQRTMWRSFITDPNIFVSEDIYRPNDPAFGVQTELEMLVVAGIESTSAATYINNMSNGFKKKRFQFGGINSAVALDSKGNIVYEIVYAKMFDPLEPNGSHLPNIVQTQYYPNSISNWQNRLEVDLATERNYLPLWMRTIQPGSKEQQDYTLAVPICYCKAGKASSIILNIKHSAFDFRSLDYTIDRFVIRSLVKGVGDKYLLFNNNRTTI